MQKSFAAVNQNFDVLYNYFWIGPLKRNEQALQDEEIHFFLPCRSTELLELSHQIKHEEKRNALVSSHISSPLYVVIHE